ncbi:hypothetical protein QOT17_014956 [Balamuthia mandrillaris]
MRLGSRGNAIAGLALKRPLAPRIAATSFLRAPRLGLAATLPSWSSRNYASASTGPRPATHENSNQSTVHFAPLPSPPSEKDELVTREDFFERIIYESLPVALLCFTQEDEATRAAAELIRRECARTDGRVLFCRLKASSYPELAQRLEVAGSSFPTLLVLKEGVESERLTPDQLTRQRINHCIESEAWLVGNP